MAVVAGTRILARPSVFAEHRGKTESNIPRGLTILKQTGRFITRNITDASDHKLPSSGARLQDLLHSIGTMTVTAPSDGVVHDGHDHGEGDHGDGDKDESDGATGWTVFAGAVAAVVAAAF